MTGLTSDHGEPPPEPQPAPRHRTSSCSVRRAPSAAAAKSCLLRPGTAGTATLPGTAGRLPAGWHCDADAVAAAPGWTVGGGRARSSAWPRPRAGCGARCRRTATRSWRWPWRRTRSRRRWPAPRWPRSWWSPTTRRRPRRWRALGARMVPDPPGAGLNAAFAHGAAAGRRRRRGRGAHRRPAGAAPGRAGRGAAAAARRPRRHGVRRFVADAAGTGTVLLTAPPGVPLDPRFGAGLGGGARRLGRRAARPGLAGPAPRRRHRRRPGRGRGASGSGAHTRRAAALRCRATPVYGAVMQGTVATLRPGTRSPARCCSTTAPSWPSRRAAFDASGLRLLRLGQRVRIDRDDAGTVVRITIPTLA